MTKERVKIEDDLAAKVIFDSDTTCCVCRQAKQKVQIHHVDGDPSHNKYDNLAVVCLNCHSDVHTNNAFARNISKETLSLYNSDWREIVTLRRATPGIDASALIEYEFEALSELSGVCHDWKMRYSRIHEGGYKLRNGFKAQDSWERMANSETDYAHVDVRSDYLELFGNLIDSCCRSFECIATVHSTAFSVQTRTLLLRSVRRLTFHSSIVRKLPSVLEQPSVEEQYVNDILATRYEQIIEELGELDREVNRIKDALSE